jgi:ABC-type nitrate/sulfonate/bicarbonate transport system substrate-binding protein
LIAKPEINTFADLKGKVVGLSLAIDTISISTRKLLALNAVKEGDFKVKELVGTPARADCLRKNECDAVPLGQPEDFVLLKQGFRRLGVSTDAMANFQFIVSAARRSWAAQNSDALVRYARALGASFRSMCASRPIATKSCASSSTLPAHPRTSRAKSFRFTSNLTGAWCRNRARSTSKDSTR